MHENKAIQDEEFTQKYANNRGQHSRFSRLTPSKVLTVALKIPTCAGGKHLETTKR